MRCERCQGDGKVLHQVPYIPSLGLYSITEIPCPRCDGSGIDHCCDGSRVDGCADEESPDGLR